MRWAVEGHTLGHGRRIYPVAVRLQQCGIEGDSMNSTTTASSEYEYLERWRRWQLGYATSSRRGALQARILFAGAVTAALVWLGLRALSWSV